MSSKTSPKCKFINGTSLVLGIISVIVRMFSLSVAGEPYDMLHKLDGNNIVPPVWMLNLLLNLAYFIAGYAAGIVSNTIASGNVNCEEKMSAYRGGMYFIAAYFLTLIHYPLFFVSEKLSASLIVIVITLISLIICIYSWAKFSPSAAMILTVYFIITIYLFFINLFILMNN